MSTELIAILALVFIVLAGAAGFVLGRRQRAMTGVPAGLDARVESALSSLPHLREELGGLKTVVQGLPRDETVKSIEGRLTKLEGAVDSRLPANFPEQLRSLDGTLATIKSEYEPGKRFEEIHDATKRLMNLLAGGPTRGWAGESIVAETLRLLPPTMLERDFKVDGKTVEFALILPNSKRLPIDSKWPASDLLERLEKTRDVEGQQRLVQEIEKAVSQRASEVSKYRNVAVTTDIGIAAVPDAAYGVCRKAHIQAFSESNVLVIPYSMLAPYVLALYNVYLKYGQAIEFHNVQTYVGVIEQELKNIDSDLENRVREAGTRVNNAYESIKTAVAKIRAASEYLRTAPSAGVPAEAEEYEKAQRAGSA